jgi:hypothetical protein
MNDYDDSAGYQDCVLNSCDDYEPYGYLPADAQVSAQPQRQLQPVELVPERRNPTFDRVIEAQLLAQSSMVGC